MSLFNKFDREIAVPWRQVVMTTAVLLMAAAIASLFLLIYMRGLALHISCRDRNALSQYHSSERTNPCTRP